MTTPSNPAPKKAHPNDHPQDLTEAPALPAAPSLVAQYFKITVGGSGQYELETNMGDGWQVHALLVAKKLREDLL